MTEFMGNTSARTFVVTGTHSFCSGALGLQPCWFQVTSRRGVGSHLPHAARIRKCFAKTDHFRDWLFVSEGFDAETEINDLNTFTTRVEKRVRDVGSESDGLLPPLWLKADT